MSDIRLKIVDADTGEGFMFGHGQQIEAPLADALVSRLKARGVGMFTSEASVLTAVREELTATVSDLFAKVR